MKTKKLLGTTLALAMILPYSANAELFKNLKLSGQLDLQGTAARNTLDFSTRFKPVVAAQNGGTIAASAGAANNDRIGDMQTRLMLSLDWDLLDDVHSKITLTKNDRSWGTTGNGGAAQAASQVNATGQTLGPGGTNILGTVWVDQAYVKVDKVFGAVDTTLGRQYYGTPGDVIIYIGPSDKAWYGLPTGAIDAARFDWAADKVGVTALAGKIGSRNVTAGVPSADVDLTGAIIKVKATDQASVDLYTWNVQTHATGPLGNDPTACPTATAPGCQAANGKNDNLYITGAKVKFAQSGAWFDGEFAKNWGDNRTGLVTDSSARYKGWMLHTNLGYKVDASGLGGITGWGDFGFGTGQRGFHSNERRGFVAVSGDYRPGSIYGRFAAYNNGGAIANGLTAGVVPGGNAATGNLATNTLSNRVIYGLGIKVNPSAVNKLTVGASLWDFHTQTLLKTNAPLQVGGAPTATAYSGNKHIGYETDIDIVWKHSDNVSFAVGAGRFMPGGIIYEANQSTRAGNPDGGAQDLSTKDGQGVNPALMAYFDARIKF
ncbi:MAG: hypothetical protein HY077_03000 [Elusimicrobia bacterium]|nr:hypothetical protein [Elusimicrobiota bacterium]